MKKRRGESCMEFVVVIAIIMLLSTLAVVALGKAKERAQETVESCTTIDYGSRVETICDERKVRTNVVNEQE